MRSSHAAAVIPAAALLASVPSASAAWTVPRTVPTPAASVVALATNARGDAAFAWAAARRAARYRSSVHIAVRTAGGRLRTHELWSSRHAATGAISVALDARGEATVAWVTHGPRDGPRPRGGHGTVRAAWGRGGRWAAAQAIGPGSPDYAAGLPAGRGPHLAVRPDGQVLLAWDDADAKRPGVTVAWRRPGRGFSRRTSLPRSRGGRDVPLGAIPVFDARGRAFVHGDCAAIVSRTAPGSRRFGRPRRLWPGGTRDFSLVLAGEAGVAAWVAGGCADAADGAGAVYAAPVRAGVVATPVLLGGPAVSSTPVANPGGGGAVTWDPGAVSARLGEAGPLAPPAPVPDGLAPRAATGGGDEVLVRSELSSSTPLPDRDEVVVAPAGGRPRETAPEPAGALAPRAVAVAAPAGRAAAVVWELDGGDHALSVWRP